MATQSFPTDEVIPSNEVSAVQNAENEIADLLDEETTLFDRIELTSIAGQVIVDLGAATNSMSVVQDVKALLEANGHDVRFGSRVELRLRVDVVR